MSCGVGPKDGAIIQCDHIIPLYSRPDLALDPENLQVLCRECNLGKSNKYADDLRPRLEPPPPPEPPKRPRITDPEYEAKRLKFMMSVAEKLGMPDRVDGYLREYQDLMAQKKTERPKPQSVVAALLKDMPKEPQ